MVYIDAFNELSDVRELIPYLKSQDITEFEYIDTTDYWLWQRIARTRRQMTYKRHSSY